MAVAEPRPASDARSPADRPAAAVGGASVSVRDFTKRFDRVLAVDDVTLDIAAGEFVSLLGPSGSGKTTLLMGIAGFEHPTSGRVEIGGQDCTWLPANKRNLGMVFQRYTLFPHLTVTDNVAFPLKMRGLPKAERRRQAEAALETVRLGGYGARMPAQLSGGQQQRVALARAIVYRPRVLLMDEPLSALDRNLREEMQLEIKHLHAELGLTVVFVTHDQGEALTMSDRVAVLRDGRIQQIGAARDLYERPANLFTAGFVGEMNLLPATVAAAGAEPAVRLDDGTVLTVRPDAVMDPLSAGAAAAVCVRPERVKLTSPDAPGAVAARVKDVVYAGAAVLVIGTARDGTELRARLPGSADIGGLVEGRTVGFRFPPEALLVYSEGRT
jgi:spermidine/putrescine ABC transporter ATP-binding subunit